jgi:thiol-disulfide isomerase/thioredoxin
LLGAFVILTAFIAWKVSGAALQRSPENRLRSMAPRVGASALNIPWDPAVHDRDLIRGDGDARPFRIAQLGDRTLFVNFWATWCEPCVRELPSMLSLARSLPPDRFAMVSISYDEDWQTVESFFRKHLGRVPPELNVVLDPTPESDPLKKRYGTEKLPETYIVQGGVIRHKFVNAHDWEDRAKREYFHLLLSSAGD